MIMVEVTDAEQKSAACAEIIPTLPDWFGQPEANARYVLDIADKIAFAAFEGARPRGLIALKLHFGRTAEIWWLGVRPEFHRQGIGRALFSAAEQRARERRCKQMIALTVSERSDDRYYAHTRAFYEAMGFAPLVEFNENDPQNPMMCVIRPLD